MNIMAEVLKDGSPVPDDIDLFNGGISQAWMDTMAWIRQVKLLVRHGCVFFDPRKSRYWTDAGELEIDSSEIWLGCGPPEALQRRRIIREACQI